MKLLAVYVALVVVGDVIVYFLGLGIERMWPTGAVSLMSFLAMFFLVFFGAWKIAVRVT